MPTESHELLRLFVNVKVLVTEAAKGYREELHVSWTFQRYFNDGAHASGRQLLFWALPFRLPDISSAFYFRGMTTFHEHYANYFVVNSTEMVTHAHAIGTRLLLLQPGYEAREKV